MAGRSLNYFAAGDRRDVRVEPDHNQYTIEAAPYGPVPLATLREMFQQALAGGVGVSPDRRQALVLFTAEIYSLDLSVQRVSTGLRSLDTVTFELDLSEGVFRFSTPMDGPFPDLSFEVEPGIYVFSRSSRRPAGAVPADVIIFAGPVAQDED